MQEIQDDIILAFRQGKPSAFDAIYDQFYQPIITFCKYLVPAEDAEEITADIFIRLWKSRETWDSIKNIKAFLFMCARNACIDFLRYQKSKAEKQKEIAELMAREQEFILMSEMESELIIRIKKEIESLPKKCKDVFLLSYFHGYENTEIAARLNISGQTVKNLKSIALKTIRTSVLKRGIQVNILVLALQIARRIN